MKHTLLVFVFVCLNILSALAQTVTINGSITDARTGEALISANIYEPVSFIGTATNLYGFYSLKLPSGKQKLTASYTGYQSINLELSLNRDTTIHFRLEPIIELQEITVSGRSPQQSIESTQMGVLQLSPANVEKIPVLLGESDIIKTMQMMPGVQGGTEGMSGFYVRGGGPDQNLILLDGVPVYNVSHLFGFMSVFNTDALRNVSLTKGGFPARYGGRLSSVLDIRMKEGNDKEFKGSASIGLLSSQATIEGPIVKERTSFMVSGRRSYFDLLTYPLQAYYNKVEDDDYWIGYYLQDFNAKVNHRINDRHRLYLSMYTGKDKFYAKDNWGNSTDKAGLQWGNLTGALRWNYIMTNNLFLNVTATLSDFTFKFFEDYNSGDANSRHYYSFYEKYYSRIRDYAVRADFDYTPNHKNNVKFGISQTFHQFSPGVTVSRDRSGNSSAPIDTTYGNINIPARQLQAYLENEFTLNRRIMVNAGLHVSRFDIQNKAWHSVEPRLSARYLILPHMAFKTSYAYTTQYLHLITNTTMGLPTDLWVPATPKTRPQEAWQVAAGFSYALNNAYEISLEGYYKEMKHLVEYAEGASFYELNRGDWEDLITSGSGESYGVELLVQKPSGRLSGWAGYTLSWANRTFPEISFGRTFPYNYDARHDFTVVATYKLSNRTDFGANWTYRTGYPFTLADEQYAGLESSFSEPGPLRPNGNNDIIEHYDTRNNYRMPNYHRLDVGFNMHKQRQKTFRTWSFGVYNVYANSNPFMLYNRTRYDEQTNEVSREIKQVSVFNFIPYIKWGIKF
ncbi:TonB-dependent receptor [Alkaliflexus imshenetskii]|uniref:TonB-dependent receptor n=1 Tax=Alkaliflexus imshenetskii TaxID=286730 RepID=UPI00047E5195|nr:TonB-dependent receptor [Alkaliflexus imshenetskii]